MSTFVDSSMPAVLWTASKSAFFTEFPRGKPSTAASAMDSRTQSAKLIGTKLSFQTNHDSIYGTMMTAFVLDVMPATLPFRERYGMT